ncbi:MAG: hypothetical protein Q7J15_13045 [Candidatus Desulfaltia sp.]|nr:hypothetical protein [Candidatus Desulfaltia sp.]
MKTKRFTFFCLSISLLCLIISCSGAMKYDALADASAEADVKSAFTCAMIYFIDYPDGQLNLNELNKAGFSKSEGVIITIVQGRFDNLLISSEHSSGTKIFKTFNDGRIESSGHIGDVLHIISC